MEKQKRTRIKVKANLAGSSDFRRVKSARAILVENHEKNIAFFASIKPVATSEKVILTEDAILRMYSKVSVWGNWCPVRKFIGVLVFMYQEHYKFI